MTNPPLTFLVTILVRLSSVSVMASSQSSLWVAYLSNLDDPQGSAVTLLLFSTYTSVAERTVYFHIQSLLFLGNRPRILDEHMSTWDKGNIFQSPL